jgi:hypothetical protein
MESKGEERYYSDIQEVEVASTPEEANRKLDSGFELLKIETISAEQSPEIRKLIFVLGRKKETTTAVSKPAPQGESSKEITIPESIPWTQKNESFAWAFATNKDGSLIEEYRSFVERLKLSPLEKDGYRYSLSKDRKFLQRVKVEAKK